MRINSFLRFIGIFLLLVIFFSCSRNADPGGKKPIGNEVSQLTPLDKRGMLETDEPELGDRFRDIEGMDRTGKPIALSSLEGKFILLDFWASWCGPCRKENPNLVKLYNRYHSQGFEIFSYSIDQNASAWKKSVLADSLLWTNVIEKPSGDYYPSEAIYKVKFLPTSYLIGPEGIILAKNLRGIELEEKLRKVLETTSFEN